LQNSAFHIPFALSLSKGRSFFSVFKEKNRPSTSFGATFASTNSSPDHGGLAAPRKTSRWPSCLSFRGIRKDLSPTAVSIHLIIL